MQIEKEELSIYDVEELHKDMLTQCKNKSIVIDMAHVKKVDMSIIQLFVSAQKSCKQNAKKFELKNTNNEVQKILAVCACEFLIGAY